MFNGLLLKQHVLQYKYDSSVYYNILTMIFQTLGISELPNLFGYKMSSSCPRMTLNIQISLQLENCVCKTQVMPPCPKPVLTPCPIFTHDPQLIQSILETNV